MVAGSSNWTLHSTVHLAPADSTMNDTPGNKMVLWVDAVGGFLICPSNKIVLGQALPAAGVDVAIQADISRRHATIYRDGEGYLITPASSTSVNGRPLGSVCALTHGSVIELGSRVRMKFEKPHPLSATARLTMLSHHRTQPAVDGVILMADAMVLGPKTNCHIVARHWENDIVLFRSNHDWIVRGGDSFEVDGMEVHGQAAVTPGNRIAGKDFSLSIESV